MSNTNYFSYVSLKSIVAMFLDQYDKSNADADKCWVLAWRALVNIFHTMWAEPKTMRLPKNANDTVSLPADYAGWTKIGILNSDNTVSTLRINNNLTLFADNNPNRENALTPNTQFPYFNNQFLYPFYLNYYYNQCCYVLNEALPEGVNYMGECRVDDVNKVIVLNKNFKYDNIMLEYKSVPQQNDDYEVETFLQEPIIAFLEWKFKFNTEQNYYNRMIEARRSLPNKKVTLQQLEQMARYGNAYKIRI